MSYTGELVKAMNLIAALPDSIFLGQGVGVPSTIQTDTLEQVPKSKRIEFPVAEDLQMGMAIGMALVGFLPVCIYPRWDFLLLAANQLVLHLDRIADMSLNCYTPKVIVRVVSPSIHPFDPGPQHGDDFGHAFRQMLRLVEVVELSAAKVVVPEYEKALARAHSTVLVEYGELYDKIPSGVMG